MKTILILTLLLSGCIIGEENTAENKKQKKETGILRHELFVECMNLAAKMPRQADDDVSDIVDECSQEAYYMANHINE